MLVQFTEGKNNLKLCNIFAHNILQKQLQEASIVQK